MQQLRSLGWNRGEKRLRHLDNEKSTSTVNTLGSDRRIACVLFFNVSLRMTCPVDARVCVCVCVRCSVSMRVRLLLFLLALGIP